MKRNGPALTGICLDRTTANDCYIPVFHVHNLLWPWPSVTLTLYHAVPDERQPRLKREIPVDRHQMMFEAAAESLKRQAPEILLTGTGFRRLLQMYNEYIESQRNPAISRYPVNLFRDVILLAFWAGYHDYAMGLLAAAAAVVESLPQQQTDPGAWAQAIESELREDRLDSTLNAELHKHKLGNVPEYEFAVDGLPERSIVDVYLDSVRRSGVSASS